MVTLYADLCEMGERATRENVLGLIVVPNVLDLPNKVEAELEKRGSLKRLLEMWNPTI